MNWIIVSALLLVAALVALRVRRKAEHQLSEEMAAIPDGSQFGYTSSREYRDVKSKILITTIALCAIGVIFALNTVVHSVHIVENGHVGLVYTFGGITGQRGDGDGGAVFTFPFQDVKSANVQVQRVQPDTVCGNGAEHCMDTFSSESQDVYVTAQVNFHVDPTNIQSLYRNVGPDYVDKLILSRVAQITKEETVKYGATEVAPHREELRATIARRLSEELQARSITVDDFLLVNIDFTPEFKQAIANKVQAEQDAQTEANKVAIKEAQADQAVAEAQGHANAQIEEAKGIAESNRLITESLSPELIQYETVLKLAPNVNVMLLPSGDNGFILDIGSMTSGSGNENIGGAPAETPTPEPGS